MKGFAIYRLPHEQQCTLVRQTSGEPMQLDRCALLHEVSGFVMAPFSVTPECPLLLIRPDRVETYALDDGSLQEAISEFATVKLGDCNQQSGGVLPSDAHHSYADSFRRFHERLVNDDFRKVVLSRCLTIPHAADVNPIELFERACRRYPRLFVALAYTPQSGMWLTATPEILLEGIGDQWRTIALAGTMKLEGEELNGEGEQMRWSPKNIEEQRLVASYIYEQLKPYANNLREEGPRTVRAANLVHLRSDFSFTLLNNGIGELLDSLHPTPAVCGLPKSETYRFILDQEPTPRRYYSGFMGPLNIRRETHLYVALRCMEMTREAYHLYAGGGLLKESVEEQEWQETEAKLETMKEILVSPL